MRVFVHLTKLLQLLETLYPRLPILGFDRAVLLNPTIGGFHPQGAYCEVQTNACIIPCRC